MTLHRCLWQQSLPCRLFVALAMFAAVGHTNAADPPASGREFSGMSFLDNGTIRLGVDLDRGGAITWLSASKSDDNVVNSFDNGRQIQMSFYSGPVPYLVGPKRPAKHWEQLGWNPIQAGDDYGHGSVVLAHRNDGRHISLECRPLQWPLDNEPAECTFGSFISLDGNVVRAHGWINNARADKTQYPARRQELPAIYTNAPLYRLMTYTGDKPFTGDKFTRIEKKPGESGPWSNWQATENWSALVRDDDWGLGVWQPGCYTFGGGFAGKPGVGGPHDNPTGYLSPGFDEIIDHDIQYEYQYVLILGRLEEIRRYVYDHAPRRTIPDFHFDRDRQHWRCVNAHDTGWPIRGELHVIMEEDDPQLIGPAGFWQAADAPRLYIDAAFHTQQTEAKIFWQTYGDQSFSEQKSLTFTIRPDGEFHTYAVDLSSSPAYRGQITGLRFDPVPSGHKGEFMRVKSILATKKE